MASDEMKWYVIHTYSGFENKAKDNLEERVRQNKMEDYFSEILIPSEEVVERSGEKKKVTRRKFFPGYMLVKMLLNDETYHLVKNTPKITGFVGGARNPPSVPDEEAERLTRMISEESLRPKPVDKFESGEVVKVVDGPFQGFNGVVDEVRPEKGKVRVLVSIFGRQTPVQLDFVQVEKG